MATKGQFKVEISTLAVTAFPSFKILEVGREIQNCYLVVIAFLWVIAFFYFVIRAIEDDNKKVFDSVVDYHGKEMKIKWRSDWENTHLHLYRVWVNVSDVTQTVYGNRKPIREFSEIRFFDVWWTWQGRYVVGNALKNEFASQIRRDNVSLKGKSINIQLIHFTGQQQRV